LNFLVLPATQPVTGRESPCFKQEIADASYFCPLRRCRHRLHRTCRVEPGAGRVSSDPLADSGFCQIWDQNIPTAPYPGNYTVIVGSEVPTFGDALVFKDGLLRNGTCSF
jgi:hypothetical protein